MYILEVCYEDEFLADHKNIFISEKYNELIKIEATELRKMTEEYNVYHTKITDMEEISKGIWSV